MWLHYRLAVRAFWQLVGALWGREPLSIAKLRASHEASVSVELNDSICEGKVRGALVFVATWVTRHRNCVQIVYILGYKK